MNVSASARLRAEPPETVSSSSAPGKRRHGAAEISAATPEAKASSCTCPSSPKPVTSVSAWAAPTGCVFSVVITSIASDRSTAKPRLCAVTSRLTPKGFVSTSVSPTRPPALVSTARGSTVPVTASPYFGSGSSIECPPTIEAPAAVTASKPPRRISRSTSGPSTESGYATRFKADTGVPPIA